MKPLLITGLLVLAMLGLTACSSGSGTDRPQPEQTTQTAEAAGNMEREDAASQEQTEYISAVPEEYFVPSGHPGQVVEITYDSRNYTDPAEPAIQKTAYVYLPYDYDEADEDTRYDVLYLMHGWTMTAGDFFDPAQSDIVPMLDHMIENGDIPPVIAVCATFDAQNQSQGFSRSVEELSVFHRDLRENLIPFVESRYHTYAQDVTEEGLQASREHRAFGGFSLGAVTTWYQFIYNLDYIQYFVPMSGDCWIMGTYGGLYQPVETVDYLEQVVSDGGWDGDDFCIYQGIGTSDPIWDQTDSQIQEMLTRDLFTPENLHYAIIEGGRHDVDACERYLYHALQRFFGNTEEGDHLDFEPVTRDTLVRDVMDDPVFEDHGRLLFPVDLTIPQDMTLEDVGDLLVWYHHVNPDKTVEIVNTLGERAASGDTVFFDIYTDEERAADPEKADTGLSEVTGEEPPTYCCVGTRDGIASYRVMEGRVRCIQANGTDAEIEVFQGLPHGFGLGEGTVAEGWIDRAIDFWERQMQ